jgi:hypothetical protein
MDMRLHDRHIAKDPDISSASLYVRSATRLFKTSTKLRRDACGDHWVSQVHRVITGKLMHLDSAGGHPTPPKKWIFLEQVTRGVVFCREKVDFSGKGDQFVASARGEADLLNVKNL